jgi:hypothetical protein
MNREERRRQERAQRKRDQHKSGPTAPLNKKVLRLGRFDSRILAIVIVALILTFALVGFLVKVGLGNQSPLNPSHPDHSTNSIVVPKISSKDGSASSDVKLSSEELAAKIGVLNLKRDQEYRVNKNLREASQVQEKILPLKWLSIFIGFIAGIILCSLYFILIDRKMVSRKHDMMDLSSNKNDIIKAYSIIYGISKEEIAVDDIKFNKIIDKISDMSNEVHYLGDMIPIWNKNIKEIKSYRNKATHLGVIKTVKVRIVELESAMIEYLNFYHHGWNLENLDNDEYIVPNTISLNVQNKGNQDALCSLDINNNVNPGSGIMIDSLSEQIKNKDIEIINLKKSVSDLRLQFEEAVTGFKNQYQKKWDQERHEKEELEKQLGEIQELKISYERDISGLKIDIQRLNEQNDRLYRQCNAQNDLHEQLHSSLGELPNEVREIIARLEEATQLIENRDVDKITSRDGLRLLDESVYRSLPAKSLLNMTSPDTQFLHHAIGVKQAELAGKLQEMGMRILNPTQGTLYNPEYQDSDYTTDTVRTAESSRHNTIERVIKIGYAWENNETSGSIKKLRSARVIRYMRMEDVG